MNNYVATPVKKNNETKQQMATLLGAAFMDLWHNSTSFPFFPVNLDTEFMFIMANMFWYFQPIYVYRKMHYIFMTVMYSYAWQIVMSEICLF